MESKEDSQYRYYITYVQYYNVVCACVFVCVRACEKTTKWLLATAGLTVIAGLPERSGAHHALGAVGQGQAAAHGGGAIQVIGGVSGRADAIGPGDPGAGAGDGCDWGTAREEGRERRERRGQYSNERVHTH